MDKKEISINQKKVTYTVAGNGQNGQVVLFIHGFGEHADVWRNQVSFLQNKFRLIIPDLPGSSDSEMIDDMSMKGLADAILEILDHEKIDRCTIIGHSMGGYVLLAFAEKYSARLNAFGLFHSTAFPDTEEKKNNRRKGISFIQTHGAFEFLKNTTPNLFSPESQKERPELIENQVQALTGFTPEALIAYYEAMIQRPDRTKILQETALPVLFIAGNYDTAVPLNDCLKQSHLPSVSFFHLLENSGHMGMLEESVKANMILEDFLNKTSAL
ncbi:MAG: alpha/beta hydrolase [Chitinophagaceae bacterium]